MKRFRTKVGQILHRAPPSVPQAGVKVLLLVGYCRLFGSVQLLHQLCAKLEHWSDASQTGARGGQTFTRWAYQEETFVSARLLLLISLVIP